MAVVGKFRPALLVALIAFILAERPQNTITIKLDVALEDSNRTSPHGFSSSLLMDSSALGVSAEQQTHTNGTTELHPQSGSLSLPTTARAKLYLHIFPPNLSVHVSSNSSLGEVFNVLHHWISNLDASSRLSSSLVEKAGKHRFVVPGALFTIMLYGFGLCTLLLFIYLAWYWYRNQRTRRITARLGSRQRLASRQGSASSFTQSLSPRARLTIAYEEGLRSKQLEALRKLGADKTDHMDQQLDSSPTSNGGTGESDTSNGGTGESSKRPLMNYSSSFAKDSQELVLGKVPRLPIGIRGKEE